MMDISTPYYEDLTRKKQQADATLLCRPIVIIL